MWKLLEFLKKKKLWCSLLLMLFFLSNLYFPLKHNNFPWPLPSLFKVTFCIILKRILPTPLLTFVSSPPRSCIVPLKLYQKKIRSWFSNTCISKGWVFFVWNSMTHITFHQIQLIGHSKRSLKVLYFNHRQKSYLVQELQSRL